ncbi:class I SAM-dependent methyltransferase [Skermania sp. ID1734]|nr:class I SAM-dependent methyltransferase [Skermania sp. ID1734]
MAESFGVDPERYNRARPAYPAGLIDRIVRTFPGRDVLDVGCGTGIEARQFHAAGCRVLGVDPDRRMAEFARTTGIDVEVSRFEEWDPANRSFDAVVSGQAWHWVDPVAGAVKAAQLLRPHGILALFAHVFEPPPPVSDALRTVLQRVAPDLPFGAAQVTGDERPPTPANAYRAMYIHFGDAVGQTNAFGEPEHFQLEWERAYTRDEWLDLLATTGMLTRLSTDALAQISDGVGAAIDAIGDHITVRFTTLAMTARRR